MRLYTLIFIHILILITACTNAERDQYPEGMIKAQIPIYQNQGYQFQAVEFLTVQNMVDFKGAAAQFLTQPKVTAGVLSGFNPKIKTVRNQSGVYIATDEISLTLLTIYYHLERLMKFDEQIGAKAINSWPRKVAMQVNYIDSRMGKIENNALYSGDLDALLYVPYTQESMPIPINSGIIAHEHFHSLFFKVVINPLVLEKKYPDMNFSKLHSNIHDESALLKILDLPNDEISKPNENSTSQRDMYHTVYFRGLNEGLADFWGWLYSQDNDFVSRSLPQVGEQRKLDINSEIISESCLKRKLFLRVDSNNGTVAAYEFGTSIARNLRQIFLNFQQENKINIDQARIEFGKLLFETLPELRDHYAKISTRSDEMSTSLFIDLMAKKSTMIQLFNLRKPKKEDCQWN